MTEPRSDSDVPALWRALGLPGARHPRLTATVAHLGAPEFDGFLALAGRHDRVHLDTTMIFTRFAAPAAFPAALFGLQ